jgi:2-polyprenyl-6-hydroxyphenyl methylase/3-demethylubiquinone-9 3-methyltransferase
MAHSEGGEQPSPEVKHYFRDPGTVVRWWNPEDSGDPHFDHFKEQLSWVMSQYAWSGARVLDVGTGKGRFSIPYAQEQARVVAMDLSAEMLQEACRRARGMGAKPGFVLGDAEHLPFPKGAFQIVSCMEMLMHVPDPQAVILEVARVMDPDGGGLLSITNKWRLNSVAGLPVSLARGLRLNRTPKLPTIAWYYSARTFKQFLSKAGLRILSFRGQGLFQAGAHLRLTRRFSVPLVPPRFRKWFFRRVEPALREGPLLRVMGTLMARVVPGGLR